MTRALQQRVPGFDTVYAPDQRQDIAASWPNSLDDSAARRDWGWSPRHDVDGLVAHVLEGLAQQSNVDKPVVNV